MPAKAQIRLAQRPASTSLPLGLPLRQVKVSDSRVIRTISGLRPFRREGFVVKGQRFGDKTVVHNYGHGGGGITLSWGDLSLGYGNRPANRP